MEGTPEASARRIVKMSAIDSPVLRPAIMLVDDAEPYMHVMSSVLRGCGLEVHMARGAPEALVMLDQMTPDLILLDVMMPQVDGISFLRQLRADARLGLIPVVVVTAYPDTRQAALTAGADGFLAKPFTTQQLRTAIAEFLQVGPIR
jgi:CheY-like chemotaxis protein